ncbi:MAG: DUF3122 domain-containing protein, partial [Cyanobium sp.]
MSGRWGLGRRRLAPLAAVVSRMAVLMVMAVVLLGALLAGPASAWAQIQASPQETATGLVRSLESLRDLDYESWQLVAYREGASGSASFAVRGRLRIGRVGKGGARALPP